MDEEFNGQFARLVPRNALAQRLFSHCHAYVQEKDPFHLDFMVTEAPRDEDSSTSFDESIYEAHGITEDPGFFILSFHGKGSSEIPQLGWRVGRVNPAYKHRNGNVDIMLASPEDPLARSLKYNHFRLSMSPQSGFLMLEAGDLDKPSLRHFVGGRWEKLSKKATRVLYEQTTILRAGHCEYDLVYTVDPKQSESFISQRQEFLLGLFGERASMLQYAPEIPGGHHELIGKGRYSRYESRGHGTFGWVNRAVDTHTGHLVAVKELQIKTLAARKEIEGELKIGNRFPNSVGLLPITDSFCEHGQQFPCGKREKFQIVMPFALLDFSKITELPDYSHAILLEALYGPLQGLKTLHESGIMHRDIRPANMLVTCKKPLTACICDYGKATHAKSSSQTSLGPICTLAPEVWEGPYTNSIDIWAFGYAIAGITGYRCNDNPRITRERHIDIMVSLSAYGMQSSECKHLSELALSMLAWNPMNRPTAADALLHICWASVRTKESPLQAGKHGLDDKILTSSQETEEFSEETKAMLETDRTRRLRTS